MAQSDGESTKIEAVKDHGWQKEGSCKVAVSLEPPFKSNDKGEPIKVKEVDGFKWTAKKDGKDYEIFLPAGVTPEKHGATI